MANGWTGGQFSLVRVILGGYLLVELTRHALLIDRPALATLAWIGAALAVPLALGWHRWSAAGLWAVVTLLAMTLEHYPLTGSAIPPSARVLTAMGALVLLVIAMLPAEPFGAWPARWRVDPDGGWRWPGELFAAAWAVVAGMFFVWAALLVPDLGWHVADRGMRLGAFGRLLPQPVWIVGNWALLGAWLAMGPLALARAPRPLGWLAVLIVNVTVLPLAAHAFLAPPLVMLALVTFDPAWLARRARRAGERDTLFYDGECGLCHRAVRFVIAEDAAGEVFELAPLQSEHFHETVPLPQRQRLPDSIVLRRADGTLLVKSQAICAMLDQLGGYWRVLARLARLVPRPIRDLAYDAIARVRLRLFARPADLCPIMPAHLRARFRM